MRNKNTKRIVGIGLFTAIVVVLQLLGSFIHFGPFSISLVLIPIVVGAAMYGVGAGTWLGFIFGLAVLLSGDAAFFMSYSAFGTILTVLAKGTLAGLCSGLIFRLLEKKNTTLAVAAASVICPVVNTGVFLIGTSLFLMPAVADLASQAQHTGSLLNFMFVGLVGLNFVVELAINVVLNPVILRIIRIGKKN